MTRNLLLMENKRKHCAEANIRDTMKSQQSRQIDMRRVSGLH